MSANLTGKRLTRDTGCLVIRIVEAQGLPLYIGGKERVGVVCLSLWNYGLARGDPVKGGAVLVLVTPVEEKPPRQ